MHPGSSLRASNSDGPATDPPRAACGRDVHRWCGFPRTARRLTPARPGRRSQWSVGPQRCQRQQHRRRAARQEFKKGPRRRRRDRSPGRAGRDLRLSRAERRGQVDDGADAHDAASADRRVGAGRPASTSSSEGPQVRATIGAALQEAALDPLLTGREHCACRPAARLARAEREARSDELLERVGLDRRRRPQGRRLLGRHEAAARPRAGARPPPAHPLPRRADDRPRPAEPHGAVGGGRPAGAGRTASPSS